MDWDAEHTLVSVAAFLTSHLGPSNSTETGISVIHTRGQETFMEPLASPCITSKRVLSDGAVEGCACPKSPCEDGLAVGWLNFDRQSVCCMEYPCCPAPPPPALPPQRDHSL